MILEDIDIVPIQQQHNASIATIIRTALEEFGANKPGTVYFDASTDTLSELFNTTAKSQYYIALHNNMVVGGAGIFPTESLPNDTIELVKMYLHPSARNIGLGKKMIQFCMASAKQLGFTKLYLETLPELNKAVKVYENLGFQYLNKPLGNSGHTGCNIWMIQDVV